MKILLIIVIVLAVMALLAFFGLKKLWHNIATAQMAPDNYTSEVKTGGVIEAKCLARGGLETKSLVAEYPDDADIGKITVWYPAELEALSGKYPVVLFVNGTGVGASRFAPVFEHMASWGFIAVGNEDPSTWEGKKADATLAWVLRASEEPGSVFYGKVDVENIGVVGHSQGGVGVYNTASTVQLAEVVQYIYDRAGDFGIDRNAIFIGGNSAGAHLSSQLGALFTDREYADRVGVDVRIPGDAIKGLLLFNGVYNFDTAEDCGFFAFGKRVWAYTGRKDYRAYARLEEMSTVRHITPDYPAVFITVGDADPLEPQTREFADRLSENGVDHTALLWTGTGAKLDHDYIYEMNTAEAQKAFEMMLVFLSEHAG